MVKTHGRYEYSNITRRPDYTWPNGKRLAVYVALNIEQFSYGEGKGAAIAPPDQSNTHSIYSWRDYGNRVGFWRLMDLFDELGIPIEAQMNTAIYDECPDIPERLRERGDEILGHGITNSFVHADLAENEERQLIEEITSTIEAREGKPPMGYMTPWLGCTEVTPDLLVEAGYRYFMDWACDDQAIWMRTRSGKILSIPYPIEANDTRGIVWNRYTAQEFADMVIDNFDEMLAQSEKQPLICPIAIHPFVVGRPYRMRQMRRALEHVMSHADDIWLTRPGDICAFIEGLPGGVVPGSEY